MTTDYGLGAMTGILPTIIVAGAATNMLDKVGLAGRQQPAPVNRRDVCSKCGSPLAADSQFCNSCGASVRTGRVAMEKRPIQRSPRKQIRRSVVSGGRHPTYGTRKDMHEVIFGGQQFNPFK